MLNINNLRGGQSNPFPKLSIVIPVYNAELWLRRCLDSCVNQEDVSKGDYEIIAVNDGSTDSSGAILEEYKKSYPGTIETIWQENKGQSEARNRGKEQALSEYIWFVDSDDWVSSVAVKMILAATIDKPDGVAISYQITYDDRPSRNVIIEHVSTGIELLRHSNHNPAQFCIFRRQFLEQNGLRFLVGHFHEDVDFSTRAKYLAKSINTISEPLYYFYMRAVSTSRGNKNPKRAFDCLAVSSSLHQFAKDCVARENLDIFGNAIAIVTNIGLNIISKGDRSSKKKFKNQFISGKQSMKTMLRATSRLHRIEAWLMLHFPRTTLNLNFLLRM